MLCYTYEKNISISDPFRGISSIRGGIGKVSNKIYDKIRSKSKKGGRYPQFYIISK